MTPFNKEVSTADLIETTAAVVRFLSEASIHLHEESGGVALTESAAWGLSLILNNVESNLNQALKMTQQPSSVI